MSLPSPPRKPHPLGSVQVASTAGSRACTNQALGVASCWGLRHVVIHSFPASFLKDCKTTANLAPWGLLAPWELLATRTRARESGQPPVTIPKLWQCCVGKLHMQTSQINFPNS